MNDKNNNFFLENEQTLNSDNEEQKGLLYKLQSMKELVNKKMDFVSTAENEINVIESRVNLKYDKLSEVDKESYKK